MKSIYQNILWRQWKLYNQSQICFQNITKFNFTSSERQVFYLCATNFQHTQAMLKRMMTTSQIGNRNGIQGGLLMCEYPCSLSTVAFLHLTHGIIVHFIIALSNNWKNEPTHYDTVVFLPSVWFENCESIYWVMIFEMYALKQITRTSSTTNILALHFRFVKLIQMS